MSWRCLLRSHLTQQRPRGEGLREPPALNSGLLSHYLPPSCAKHPGSCPSAPCTFKSPCVFLTGPSLSLSQVSAPLGHLPDIHEAAGHPFLGHSSTWLSSSITQYCNYLLLHISLQLDYEKHEARIMSSLYYWNPATQLVLSLLSMYSWCLFFSLSSATIIVPAISLLLQEDLLIVYLLPILPSNDPCFTITKKHQDHALNGSPYAQNKTLILLVAYKGLNGLFFFSFNWLTFNIILVSRIQHSGQTVI